MLLFHHCLYLSNGDAHLIIHYLVCICAVYRAVKDNLVVLYLYLLLLVQRKRNCDDELSLAWMAFSYIVFGQSIYIFS